MDKTLSSLKLARVIEEDADGQIRWAGGDTTVVQLGDVLDRGNVEIGERRGGRFEHNSWVAAVALLACCIDCLADLDLLTCT
jgi:hypothetical protein